MDLVSTWSSIPETLFKFRFRLLLIITAYGFVCVGVYSFIINPKKVLKKHGDSMPEDIKVRRQISLKQQSAIERLRLKKTDVVTRRRRRFPTCIIIGVKKGGTGALKDYLNIHPQLAVHSKETHFFENNTNYMKGLEYYRQQMPLSFSYQITIEKTPRYLVSETARERIYKFNKDIKLIVTLRHPIKRMISDYAHELRHGKSPNKTFEEYAIDGVTGEIKMDYQPVNVSMYYIHMERWLHYFPRKQIHVVDGDNLIVNPVEELKKIETFLGIKHFITKHNVHFNAKKGFYCVVRSKGRPYCMGQLKGHMYDNLEPQLYRKFYDFFGNYNKRLFALLGRTFRWE